MDDLYNAAAVAIQRCWRVYRHRWRAAQAEDPDILTDPITLEQIRGTPFRLVTQTPPHIVHRFDARALAEHFDTSLDFSNPLTREPCKPVEILRLYGHVKKFRPLLLDDYCKATTLRKRLITERDTITLLEAAIDECLYETIHHSRIKLKLLQGLAASYCMTAEDRMMFQQDILIEHQGRMASKICHEVNMRAACIVQLITENRRHSPFQFDAYCNERMQDIAKTCANHVPDSVIDDINNFLARLKAYYASQKIKDLQEKHTAGRARRYLE